MNDITTTGVLRKASGWAIAWSILIILAGFIAISVPLASGIGITILVGWILVVSGVFHVVESFHARGAGSFIWRLVVGLVYIIGGLGIALQPALGLLTLTLVLGIILLMQGAICIAAFFGQLR